MKNEDDKIKVTIMIPTYNQSAFILNAINSALDQNYPNLEVIVGDDASTDTTSEILKTIDDSRLKIVRNTFNLGRVGNYRNLLYNHASGDYVVNLDGDDYYTDSDFIAEAVRTINPHKNAVMVVAKIATKSQNHESVSRLPPIDFALGKNVLSNLPNRSYCVMHMGVIYNREAAIKIDFYRSPTISSDWESIYRLMLRGRVNYLNRVVGVWRIHGDNETLECNLEKLLDNLTIWSAIFDDAKCQGMNSILASYLSEKCIAYYAISSAVKLSITGNSVTVKFIFLFLFRYRLASLFVLLSPISIARLCLSLLGYYRKIGTK